VQTGKPHGSRHSCQQGAAEKICPVQAFSFDGAFDILEESDLLFQCASLSLFESLEACCVWDMGYNYYAIPGSLSFLTWYNAARLLNLVTVSDRQVHPV